MFCKSAQAMFVAAAVLMSVPASAQDWAGKIFQTSSHDFGVVARGEKAEFAFVLENLYVEDVHIAGVRASCSCTKPEIQVPTLKTHEKGAILARFNTPAFVGAHGATLTVTFDKPYFAEVHLQVRGYIRSDVMINPGIANFGEVDEGNSYEREIIVNHFGSYDWRIVTARCANPHLSATPTEVSRSSGQVSYRVTVRLDQQAPSGYFTEQLVLDTNDPQGRQIHVPVAGTVESGISLSPGSLFMGVVQPGQKVTKLLVVRGREPFQISQITCDGQGFTVAEGDGGAKSKLHLLSVTFSADSGSVKGEARIRVLSTVGAAPPAMAYATVAPGVANRR